MTKMPRLPDLTFGTAARHGSVTVLPVFAAAASPGVDYDLGADALGRGGLEVHESARGGIEELQARNRGRRRVLLLEGDHLLGARQNRMLTSTVMVGRGRTVGLPVSCVEQGRSRGPSSQFDGLAHLGSPRLRRIAKFTVTRALLRGGTRVADQSAIWSQIQQQQQSLRVRSATHALSHTYAARATDIAEIADQLPYPAGAVGLALGVGSTLVSVDLFDHPGTCAHYWRRLVEGAALDGLGAAPRSAALGGGAVARVLHELRAAEWSEVAAVGDGSELRTQVPAAAASLVIVDGRIVHFGVAAGAPDLASDTVRDAARSPAVDSRLAVMRHDLPDSLATRFQIVGRIGVGGTKEVFRAVDRRGGPDVAIARIPAVGPALFDEEVALLRRVETEHVPRIHEACLDPYGDGYLVMELCDGPSLAQIVENRALAVADAAPILVGLARGLRAIHDAAVLHRDIKLENVMLSSSETGARLKILDFGLSARAASVNTATGCVPIGGTLPYMAREVVRGTEIDARSDVYALGVCCFRLLVGAFPVPPRDGESQYDYLVRLRDGSADVSRLPPELPAQARAVLERMLDADRERRPYMPEVVAAFEQAFGAPPIAIGARAPGPVRPFPLERAYRVAVSVASPEHVLIAHCAQAPFVTLHPDAWGIATHVRATGPSGAMHWMRRLDGHVVTGIRADLDGDGVREIYLAGRDGVFGLGVSGAVRFEHPLRAPRVPSLLALPDPAAPRLAVDGRLLDIATGVDRGVLPFTYRGDGHCLVAAGEPRGAAYNGHAQQGFCGDHGTAAAIVHHPGDARFEVAHLEETRAGHIQLGIYGPGGARLHGLAVASCEIATGDAIEISRIFVRRAPLFGPQHAPLVVLGERGTAAVIVPLLDPDEAVPAALIAFELPSGRELWRCRPDAPGGRALLADLDSSGRPQLVIGDGRALVAYDAWSGRATAPVACKGWPVAFGDPLGSGFAHLITASSDGIELWRGPRCPPGAMAWTGARADLWRTGALRSDGMPLGPR
jgi:hypothetical protein